MKKTRPGLILHLLLAATVGTAAVAGPGSAAEAGVSVRNPHGVAVVIGNHTYEDRDVPPVDYALRDAEAFRRFVLDVLGFDPQNVIHLENATRKEMADALGRPGVAMNDIQARLNMVAPDEGSDVIVYYSGHGVPGKQGEEKGAYLLPVDVAPGDAQHDGYGYSLELLFGRLGALQRTKSVRVFLDACFTGTSDGGRLITGSPVYQEPGYPEEVTDTMMILTAVKGTQIARWDPEAEHGLFTDHLLDALYGGGDADGDGEVTAGEVKSYLDQFMSARAWLLHRKPQEAVLTTRAPHSELLLASAVPGGAFPPRPSLEGAAPDPVPGGGTAGDTARVEGRDPAPDPAIATALESAKAEEAALTTKRADRILVQHALEFLGFSPAPVDGLFGGKTRASIRAWQKSRELDETGYLTREQLEYLVSVGRDAQADDEAIAEAKRLNTSASYRAYLDRVRPRRHEAEARALLARLLERERVEEAARQRERARVAAARRADDEAFAEAKRLNTLASYRAYLDRVRPRRHEPEARALLAKRLEREREAFKQFCDKSKYGCFSIRKRDGCDGCGLAAAHRLRSELRVEVRAPSGALGQGLDPGCVGFREDLGGTREMAELVRGVLGAGYFIGDCTVDGFPINVRIIE